MLFQTIVITGFTALFQIHAISALSIATRDPSIIDVKVAGKPMKCELLPERISTQNHESRNTVCYLVEPFKGSPAVLKSIEKQPDMEAYVKAEADYTKKVGQYLYHSLTDDDNFFTLVMKDLRKGFLNDFRNTTTAPERKLFHEWYIADKNMDVTESLDKLRTSMYDQAIYHAEKHGLLFLDLHLLNAFTDETLDDTVFPDWAPSFDPLIYGVVPLPEDSAAKKERMERFKKELDSILSGSISIPGLKFILDDHSQELRPADMPAWRAADAARKKKEEAGNKAAQEKWDQDQKAEMERIKAANPDYESSDADSESDSEYYDSDDSD